MVKDIAGQPIHTLDIHKEVVIAASIDIAFEALLAELGPESELPGGEKFPMTFEPWPGGRWWRDLGDGAGHLWGHVQVIKPPRLVEITGPLFMSYPAINFVQHRLNEEGDGTRLQLTHQAIGQIPEEVFDGAHVGWDYMLNRVGEIAAGRA